MRRPDGPVRSATPSPPALRRAPGWPRWAFRRAVVDDRVVVRLLWIARGKRQADREQQAAPADRDAACASGGSGCIGLRTGFAGVAGMDRAHGLLRVGREATLLVRPD